MKRNGCTCGGRGDEFDAKEAFDNLSHKVRELGNIVSMYMSQAGVERGLRTVNAQSLSRAIDRIVGGRVTTDFPECCLIGNRRSGSSDYSWFCTGVLVNPRVVLTAGHCNIAPPGETVPTINVVALQVNDMNNLGAAEIIPVRRRFTNPGYVQSGEFNDITVLILASPSSVVPVPIASTAELNAATDTTLVGFGNTDLESTIGFGIKRTVTITFDAIKRSPSDDLANQESLYGFDANLEFVAGGGGRDACNGDSGGPAYISTPTRKLAGLTSRGTVNSPHPCGDSGIYTRVDANMSFVRETALGQGISL